MRAHSKSARGCVHRIRKQSNATTCQSGIATAEYRRRWRKASFEGV
jgi:hypothetical protein